MKEEWIVIDHKQIRENYIVAISSQGNMRLGDCKIKPIPYRQCIMHEGKRIRAYRLLANTFIEKTEEDVLLGRDVVDHITHFPNNMNINDIRNMRWCTKLENENFEERKSLLSDRKKGYVALSIENHFGKKIDEIRREYENERSYYQRHGKFSWEVN